MDHLYIIIEYLFRIGLFLIFYTYLGYGILLYIMVRIKELFSKPAHPLLPDPLPDVTLFIAAYNEEDIVASKMDNCHALAYPKDKLKLFGLQTVRIDRTNELLEQYPDVTVLFQPERKGKNGSSEPGHTIYNDTPCYFH